MQSLITNLLGPIFYGMGVSEADFASYLSQCMGYVYAAIAALVVLIVLLIFAGKAKKGNRGFIRLTSVVAFPCGCRSDREPCYDRSPEVQHLDLLERLQREPWRSPPLPTVRTSSSAWVKRAWFWLRTKVCCPWKPATSMSSDGAPPIPSSAVPVPVPPTVPPQ